MWLMQILSEGWLFRDIHHPKVSQAVIFIPVF